MKALMNVTEGFDRVLAWTDSMRYMMQSLDHINNVDQAQVLLVLAAVCLVSTEGHNRLLAEVRRDNRMLKLMDVFRQKDPDLKVRLQSHIFVIDFIEVLTHYPFHRKPRLHSSTRLLAQSLTQRQESLLETIL